MWQNRLCLRRLAVIAIILTIALTTALGSWSCTGKVESITIGGIDDITNTLIFTAEEKGFFTANGLSVAIKKYDTGSAASEAMAKGDVDIALMTEFVIVEKALQKEKVSIVATRDKFESIYLVARKDPGIENIAGLKGKRIGLPRQSINEFYLGRVLDRNGMNLQDVILVDIKPQQSPDAFNAGVVDAVVVRQSFVDQIARNTPTE